MSDTTYNKENLLEHLNVLKPTGFSLDNDGTFIKQETGKRMEFLKKAVEKREPEAIKKMNEIKKNEP